MGNTSVNRNASVGLARFTAQGAIDPTLQTAEFQREVLPEKVATRSDAKTWVHHSRLDRVDNVSRPGLARLNASGALNPFDARSLGFEFIYGFALHSDDRIFLRLRDASFSFRNARLKANDAPDNSLAAQSEFVDAQALSDGGYLTYSRDQASSVAADDVFGRLRPDGSVEPDFRFGINFREFATGPTTFENTVYVGDNRVLSVYPDGRFLAKYFGRSRSHYLSRFKADGSLDSTFQTGVIPPARPSKASRGPTTQRGAHTR